MIMMMYRRDGDAMYGNYWGRETFDGDNKL